MLEGLEVSIINFIELNNRNDRFRFDAEFVKKEYLIIESFLEKKINKRLIDVKNIVIHPSEIKREYVDEGTWFFRAQNLRPLKIENSNDVFISLEDTKKLNNNLLKKDDVLMTRSGANFGQTAIFNYDIKAICSSHVLIFRNSFFNQNYLAVFFNTKFGKKSINKGMYGGSQPEISPFYITQIPIPVLTEFFQLKVEYLLNKSKSVVEESQYFFSQAETLLLETLGLNDFSPSNEPINIKNFKESFLSSGRLDAEYYQKKYEEVINHITIQKHDKLNNLVKIKKSIEPGSDVYSDEGIPFLRVSDFNKFGISEAEKKLSNSFCEDNKELIKKLRPKKETILFSKDGSVGTAYMLRKDENIITSGAILHLTVRNKNEILPEYLTLVLNSKLIQMQAERDSGGSIILHWRINEIENVIVPIIEYSKQQEIAELVEESFRLKKQSEELLETAKRAVEIAIEENEDVAMEYIANFNLPKALNLRKVT